jgi:hypothetical protein
MGLPTYPGRAVFMYPSDEAVSRKQRVARTRRTRRHRPARLHEPAARDREARVRPAGRHDEETIWPDIDRAELIRKTHEFVVFQGQQHVIGGRGAERDARTIAWFRKFDGHQ